MTTSPSLATCPTLVYREIIKYLAPAVVVHHCKIKLYLTLQRCSNPLFAHEVRSINKEELQHAQATLAHHDKYYISKYPFVLKNLNYMDRLTFEDLCKTFDGQFISIATDPAESVPSRARRHQSLCSYAHFLFTYIHAKCRHSKPIPTRTPRIPTVSHVLNVKKTITISDGFGGNSHILWRNLKLETVGGGVEYFAWGISCLLTRPRKVRVAMMANGAGNGRSVLWKGDGNSSVRASSEMDIPRNGAVQYIIC